MKIGTDVFSGEIPKVSSRLIPDKSSQYALNCDLQSGFLKPTKNNTQVYDTNLSNQESIFKWEYNTDAAIGRTVTNNTATGWSSVTDGSILLTTAGNSYEVTGINFTGHTTMENVANTIQTRIRAATSNNDTVTWSTDHFEFNFDDNPFISMGAIYGTGTDITDTSYMNVRGDIVTTEEVWVTSDDFTYYFNSPIIDDQYQRLYSLNSVNGEYRVRDNDYQFTPTDREMILDIPDTTILESVSARPIYNDQSASPAVVSERTYDCTGYAASYDYDILVLANELSNITYSIGDEVKWYSDSTSAFMIGTINSVYDVLSSGIRFTLNITSESRPSAVEGGRIYITHEDIAAGTYYSALDGSPREGDIYDRSYVWTYVYQNGEESPISQISDEAKIYPETEASLTLIGDATPPTGVIYKNIYCTDIDQFRFLGQIDGTETTFTDNVSSTALGEEMLVYQNAPSNMNGITIASQGFCIGWRGKDVFFSESFLPYAWDDRWTLNFPHDIVSCVAVSGEIYVLTTGVPYLLIGYHPSELTPSALPFNQACSNKKAVANIGNTVLYASPDGLVSLTGSNAKLITSDLYTRSEWQDLGPTTMRLGTHDDQVYIFTDSSTYILNTRAAGIGITRTDIIADAIYEDIEQDILYFYNSTDEYISSIHTNSSDSTYIWRSKEYDFKKRTHLSCAKIVADSYNDLTLKLYADGDYSSPILSKSITSNKAFRLPYTGSYTTCSYELTGTDIVHSVQIGTNMKELEG